MFYKPKSKLDWLMVVVLLIAVADSVVNAFHNGDFIGYINVGYKVLRGKNIYFGKEITWGYFNTWPPFFSIAAVPLAILDSISPFLVRFLWLLGSWLGLFYVAKMCGYLFTKHRLLVPFKKPFAEKDLTAQSAIIIVPTLLCLRLFLENSSHLQINVYMLAMAMASVYFAYKNKPVLAGLFLGFSIAIKVFTLFLLLYFLYKRAYNVVIATVTFILLFTFSTFLFFGEQTVFYHLYWVNANVLAQPPTSQMNQSLIAMLLRLFSDVNTGMNFTANLLNLPVNSVKMLYYGLILLGSVLPLYWFRKPFNSKQILVVDAFGWAILFTAIPLLSPVAWKYYFIFLWVPIFIFYYMSFHLKLLHNAKWKKVIFILFFTSMALLTLSSELFIGVYTSDVIEVFGAVTWGGILLMITLVFAFLVLPKSVKNQPL